MTKRLLRNNALSLVLVGLFLLSWMGQGLTGWRHELQQREAHRASRITLRQYVLSGQFVEATFENWESEFLQMSAFVWLASFLRQKGSAVSKDPTTPPGEDEAPQSPPDEAPWPLRRGGLIARIYRSSLSLALLALFVFSFCMHALGGWRAFNEDAMRHGGEKLTLLGFIASPAFWFQSFQNWQSEFLSVAVLGSLSIFLRQQGSPESKPVGASRAESGG